MVWLVTQAGDSICKILLHVYNIHTFPGEGCDLPHCPLLHHWNYFLMRHIWLSWNVNHHQPEGNRKQGQLNVPALTAHNRRFHGSISKFILQVKSIFFEGSVSQQAHSEVNHACHAHQSPSLQGTCKYLPMRAGLIFRLKIHFKLR